MPVRRFLAALAILAVALTINGGALTGCETAARSDNPKKECCRYCSKGKPCGDPCINRQLTCHKGTGCACEARD